MKTPRELDALIHHHIFGGEGPTLRAAVAVGGRGSPPISSDTSNPLLATALHIGPSIFQAVLPVIHTPQDPPAR